MSNTPGTSRERKIFVPFVGLKTWRFRDGYNARYLLHNFGCSNASLLSLHSGVSMYTNKTFVERIPPIQSRHARLSEKTSGPLPPQFVNEMCESCARTRCVFRSKKKETNLIDSVGQTPDRGAYISRDKSLMAKVKVSFTFEVTKYFFYAEVRI